MDTVLYKSLFVYILSHAGNILEYENVCNIINAEEKNNLIGMKLKMFGIPGQ